MKKIAFATLFTAITFAATAQVTFGIHGNGILAHMENKSSDFESIAGVLGDFESRFSWKLGAMASVPLSPQFSFMPQFNVLSKGGKIDRNFSDFGDEFKVTGKSSLTYLELPLNFVYNSPAGPGTFSIGAGPSLSVGLGGEMELTSEFEGERESQDADVEFDGKENGEDETAFHYKAFEFGANFIAGYTLPNGLFFNVHYNLGLSNISTDNGSESKNGYFGFGIGYFFSRNAAGKNNTSPTF